MPVKITPIRQVMADNSGYGLWNPLTDPLETARIKGFRTRWWFGGLNGGPAVAPGLEFSNDGVTWSNRQYLNPSPNHYFQGMHDGWNYSAPAGSFPWGTVFSMPSYTGFKRLVRFGAYLRNGSNTKVLGMSVRLRLELDPVFSRVQGFPSRLVYTDGTDSSWTFCPFSAWMPTERINQVRLAAEVTAIAGSVAIQGGYQTANKPTSTDEGTGGWQDPDTISFGSAISSTGHHYMDAFASGGAPYAEDHVRFGLMVKQATGTSGRAAALASLTLEVRE